MMNIFTIGKKRRKNKDIKPEEYSPLIGYYDFNKGYYEINFYDNNGDKIIVYVDDYILSR